VNPSFPAKTVPELITFAKANPGKVRYASPGTGSPGHMAGELFNMMTGAGLARAAYSNAALALADVVSGQAQVMFESVSFSIENNRAGKLRALAVTSSMRSGLLPDVPLVADFLPGFEASPWLGIAAPKDTPVDIIGRLNKEINAALADPKVKAQLAEQGTTPSAGSPADFAKIIADDTENWGKVVKFAGIKAD
jgi:tripartite-type tricarboxylate transporter receptor subunit TctC